MRKDRWMVMAVGGEKRGWEVRILVEKIDREQNNINSYDDFA